MWSVEAERVADGRDFEACAGRAGMLDRSRRRDQWDRRFDDSTFVPRLGTGIAGCAAWDAAVGGRRSAVGGRRSAVGAGAIEVGAGNERYAFVSLEYSAQTAAFDLAAALRDGFRGAARVGTIPVDPGPVGIAVSPDGRLLYATSEIRRSAKAADRVGTLSVIEVPRVQTHPAPAVSCRRSTRAGWG